MCSIELMREPVTPLPLRGTTGKPDLFHGLRCVRFLADFAPPVATVRRPSGAKRCTSLWGCLCSGDEVRDVAGFLFRGKDVHIVAVCLCLGEDVHDVAGCLRGQGTVRKMDNSPCAKCRTWLRALGCALAVCRTLLVSPIVAMALDYGSPDDNH